MSAKARKGWFPALSTKQTPGDFDGLNTFLSIPQPAMFGLAETDLPTVWADKVIMASIFGGRAIWVDVSDLRFQMLFDRLRPRCKRQHVKANLNLTVRCVGQGCFIAVSCPHDPKGGLCVTKKSFKVAQSDWIFERKPIFFFSSNSMQDFA